MRKMRKMRKLILRKTFIGNQLSRKICLLPYTPFFSSQTVSCIPLSSLPNWAWNHLAYKKKKEAKLAALANDESADGTSPRSELCQEEDDELFLQSTFINDRGEYFGVGSLGKYINEKRKYPSPFRSLQEQLEIANRKIEQQASLQAEREAEALRVAAEQQAEIKLLKMVKKYLSKTDPNFQAFPRQ